MATKRKSSRNKAVSAKIRLLRREGKPQKQAVAQAINMVGGGRRRKKK